MKLYRDLYDQQLAQVMARGKGLGLADAMVRQLGGTPAAPPVAQTAWPYGNRESFVGTLWPHANRVAKSLGIAPEAIVSIAALETGWGQSVMPGPDGRSSHNLFGIKADAKWTGARVMMPTLEYENGVAVKKTEAFRAYGSLAEAVDDFGRFVRGNPRYHQALAAGRDSERFGQALADAGYATDPAYGRKLAAILRGQPLQTALKSADAAPITG
jgi:flagellar protein FlgJ